MTHHSTTSPKDNNKETDTIPATKLNLRVENQKGIHARVAAKLVKLADTHNSEATMTHNDMTVPLTSIMGLLLLSARKGSLVTVTCFDDQRDLLFKDLDALFTGKFDED